MGGAAVDLYSFHHAFTRTGAGFTGLAIDFQMFLEAAHISPQVKVVGIGSAAVFNSCFEDFFDGAVERSYLGGGQFLNEMEGMELGGE